MPFKSGPHVQPPTSLARRHFMNIAAAGAGRLSAIAISTSLIAAKSADAMGLFPRDDPRDDRGHHCFGRGTLILTPDGEIPIENLSVGDLVMTMRGLLPVRWIGRKTMEKSASASWHPTVLPVRVSRFSIDEQTPHRDLYLSPTHSLLLEGFLIPVKHLINGSSIAVDKEAREVATIEYFCIKLDTHEVVFAEGVAAETFQYRGGLINWDNLPEYDALYGGERQLMTPFEPHCEYKGGRAELRALLRLAASRFVDMRDPIQIAYGHIAARAMAS